MGSLWEVDNTGKLVKGKIKEGALEYDVTIGHKHDGVDSLKVLGTSIDSTGATLSQVLTANGAGGASWQNPGGLSVIDLAVMPGSDFWNTRTRVIKQFPWTSPAVPFFSFGPSGVWDGKVAWSKNGEFFAATGSTSPYISVNQIVGYYISSLSISAATANRHSGVAWSPDSSYLLAVHSLGNHATVWKKEGSTFTAIPLPFDATPPTGLGCDWSENGQFVAIVGSDSPYLFVYKCSGLPMGPGVTNYITFTRISAGLSALPLAANTCRFSPDNSLLAVATTSTPAFLYIYILNGNGGGNIAYSQALTPPGVTSGVADVAFSPCGNFLAVTTFTAPYLHIYSVSSAGPTFTLLPAVSSLSNSPSHDGLSWSADGRYLVAGTFGAYPCVADIYERSGSTFTKVTTVSKGNYWIGSTKWSPDRQTILMAVPYTFGSGLLDGFITTQNMPDSGLVMMRGDKRRVA